MTFEFIPDGLKSRDFKPVDLYDLPDVSGIYAVVVYGTSKILHLGLSLNVKESVLSNPSFDRWEAKAGEDGICVYVRPSSRDNTSIMEEIRNFYGVR